MAQPCTLLHLSQNPQLGGEHEAMTAEEFWQNVERGPGCWLWTGATSPKGYGRVWFNGKTRRAHRVAWLLTNGPIPDGMKVLHSCDAPQCCRPDHLFIGTDRDNMEDRGRKGRTACGERQGAWTRPECVPRGEQHGMSKTTEVDVREMRRRKALGETYQAICLAFGLHWQTVWRIVHRKSWRHVN